MGDVEYSEGSLGINGSLNLREYPLKPEKYFLLKWAWRRAWQPTAVFLPGESTWTEEPGGLPSMRLQRVGHD